MDLVNLAIKSYDLGLKCDQLNALLYYNKGIAFQKLSKVILSKYLFLFIVDIFYILFFPHQKLPIYIIRINNFTI